MTQPTISLAQWCAYLPYSIEIKHEKFERAAKLTAAKIENIIDNPDFAAKIKPLLRPMNKENQAEINRIMLENNQAFGFSYGYGFYCSDYEAEGVPTWYFGYELLNYDIVQALLAANYDIFGLIEQGLALPIE